MVGDYWNSRQRMDESLQLGFRLSVVSALGAQQKWVKSVLMNCKAPSDLALPLCDTRMFHTEASERWWLAAAGFSRGDPVFISELQASKYCLYVAVVCSQRFSEKWQFPAKNQKKKYRLRWQKKFNSPKWSMDVIWRLGTEPRHFDQEIWGGNNSDMVVFAVDERRVEVVFLFSSLPPSLSPSVCLSVCLHHAFYSKHPLTEPPSLFETHVIQDSIKLAFWKGKKKKEKKYLLISPLFFAA